MLRTQNQQQDNQVNGRKLKKFDQQIQITIDVDMIAEKLLGTFAPDYKHKELLTESIIGSTLNDGKIGYIYNALNGYENEIDFRVGEKVICSYKNRREIIWEQESIAGEVADNQPVSKPKYKRVKDNTVEIGECEIIEIDLYRDEKVKVRFTEDSYYSYGETKEQELWVSHKTCTKIPQYPKTSSKNSPLMDDTFGG